MISEVEILEKLNHKNIVKLYNWFTCPLYLYIAMEYLEGITLYKYIKSQETIEEHEIK